MSCSAGKQQQHQVWLDPQKAGGRYLSCWFLTNAGICYFSFQTVTVLAENLYLTPELLQLKLPNRPTGARLNATAALPALWAALTQLEHLLNFCGYNIWDARRDAALLATFFTLVKRNTGSTAYASIFLLPNTEIVLLEKWRTQQAFPCLHRLVLPAGVHTSMLNRKIQSTFTFHRSESTHSFF